MTSQPTIDGVADFLNSLFDTFTACRQFVRQKSRGLGNGLDHGLTFIQYLLSNLRDEFRVLPFVATEPLSNLQLQPVGISRLLQPAIMNLHGIVFHVGSQHDRFREYAAITSGEQLVFDGRGCERFQIVGWQLCLHPCDSRKNHGSRHREQSARQPEPQ